MPLVIPPRVHDLGGGFTQVACATHQRGLCNCTVCGNDCQVIWQQKVARVTRRNTDNVAATTNAVDV